MFVLKPLTRRLVYVGLFELFAIAFSAILLVQMGGGDAEDSLVVAIIISVIAVVWNYIYNLGFEAYERRKALTERSFGVRLAHAVGFEGGLAVTTLPIYMIAYQVGLLEAFVMEAGILLFFFVYTFLFTLAFDHLFPRPEAQA